ncbi:MAG: hypothetical protein SFV20_13160 [Sphingopyxis sp.]|nr:hypothetical protein [Sphingopyxis sp.]
MNRRYFAIAAAVGAATLAVPIALHAQGAATPIRVLFAKGATSKAIKGTIQGNQSRLYVINVRAGQKLSVKLATSNASSYFNITAPGAEQALFIGSTEGTSYTGTIPSSGDYKIDVYLMRNAARRNETANYTLTVSAR